MPVQIYAYFYDAKHNTHQKTRVTALGTKLLLEDLVAEGFSGTVELEVTRD